MPELVIPDVDPEIVDALRRQADAAGTSLEEQARRALTRAVADRVKPSDREAAIRRLAAIRKMISRIAGPSVVEELRLDRDSGRRMG
jgi:plasmid stability protein